MTSTPTPTREERDVLFERFQGAAIYLEPPLTASELNSVVSRLYGAMEDDPRFLKAFERSLNAVLENRHTLIGQ